jgi:hypothetical protein
MRTSKIVLITIISFFVLSMTSFTAFADDNPKKNPKKEAGKQTEKIAYSQEETKFIAEMDAYYTHKYSNPLNLIQSKVEKVIVVDLTGKVLQEVSVPDHKEHESTLPVGAEKLMVKGNTAYYLLLN